MISNEDEIKWLKGVSSIEFDVKDLGKLKYFLEMEVAQFKEGIIISQRKYTLDHLSEVSMFGSKPTNILIDFNCMTREIQIYGKMVKS